MADDEQPKSDDKENEGDIRAEGFGFKVRIPKWVAPYIGPSLKWFVIALSAGLFVYMVGSAIRMVIHD